MASSSEAKESQMLVNSVLEPSFKEDDDLFASFEQEEFLFARYDIVWQAGRGIYGSATDCGGGCIDIRGKMVDASWIPEYEERGTEVPWTMSDITVEATYECRADFLYANYSATYGTFHFNIPYTIKIS